MISDALFDAIDEIEGYLRDDDPVTPSYIVEEVEVVLTVMRAFSMIASALPSDHERTVTSAAYREFNDLHREFRDAYNALPIDRLRLLVDGVVAAAALARAKQ